MTTVDQFLRALAVVESSDDPEAWGDAGRAMGRWQVHPDRLWYETQQYGITPTLGETWDQLVGRVLRAIFTDPRYAVEPVEVAMYWHVGHWCADNNPHWDARYAGKFAAALANAIEAMP